MPVWVFLCYGGDGWPSIRDPPMVCPAVNGIMQQKRKFFITISE